MEEKKTILVVDDDENQRFLCQEVLTDEGYNVLVAKDGKEALRKVEQKRPDLVILDIVMPEMDGMEAMTRILRKHRKIPVILNTSYSSYREDFMTWAADAYVVKSSDFMELKKKIKELLSPSHKTVSSQ
jgi:CheY-like chemotaxis protein